MEYGFLAVLIDEELGLRAKNLAQGESSNLPFSVRLGLLRGLRALFRRIVGFIWIPDRKICQEEAAL